MLDDIPDRALLEVLPVGLLQISLAGRLTWANPSARDVLGVSSRKMDRLDLKYLLEHSRDEDGRTITSEGCLVTACLKSGQPQPARLMQILRPDGMSVWIQVSAVPLTEARGGMVSGVLVCFQDVTPHKRTEAALRESETMHRGLLETMRAAVLQVTHTGEITWANRNALDIIEPRTGQLSGNDGPDFFARLLDEEQKPLAPKTNPLARCLATGRPQPAKVLGIRRLDGSLIWTECAAWPMPGRRPDQPAGAVMAFFDITERRHAEIALRESEQRLRQLADCNMIGIFSWQVNGSICEANEAFLQMLGYTRDELRQGRINWREITPPEYRGMDERCLKEILTTGRCEPFEKEYFRRDGTRVAVTIGGAQLAGETDRGVAFVLDISERRKTEHHLRESDARLRLLADQMPAVLWTLDRNLRFTSSLGAGLTALHLKPGQVIGQTMQEFFDTNDPQAPPIATALRALQGESLSYEFTWRERSYQVHMEPFRSAGPEIDGCVGLAFDITERKRIEEQLIFREKRLRALIENSSDGIELVDDAGEILFESPSIHRLFGYFSAAMVGRNLFEFIHTDDRRSLEQCFAAVRKERRTIIETRYRFRHRDGTWRWVEASLNNLLDEPGVLAIVINFRDITDRQRSEEERNRLFNEIQESRYRLEQLSRRLVEVQETERRTLARDLHDELGQQLTALKLLLESSPGLPPAQMLHRVQEAHARTNQLQGLVRHMSLDLRPTMLDDLGLVPALLWLFDRRSGLSNLDIQLRHQSVEDVRFPPEIETAAYRIVQEAITNVARHAGVGAATVRLWASAETLSVQVEDKGRGFDAEAALAATTSSGLSGMRERAALLGGQLTLESTPGAGTTLTAELPIHTAIDRKKT